MVTHLRQLRAISILFLFFGLAGCSASSGGQSNTGPQSLVQLLHAAGATKVKEQGVVSQPFFMVSGHIIVIDSQSIQVYKYSSGKEMNTDLKRISSRGDIIGNDIVDWVAPPHFYKDQQGKQIVLYVGSDASTISILEKVLGPQFAGDSA